MSINNQPCNKYNLSKYKSSRFTDIQLCFHNTGNLLNFQGMTGSWLVYLITKSVKTHNAVTFYWY